MNQNKERREHTRKPYAGIIFIEILSASHSDAEDAQVLKSSTVDISREGLQITLNRAIPIDVILDLTIGLHELDKRFFLTGRVKWVREQPDAKGYRVGLQLTKAGNTDFEKWQALF